MNDLESTLKVVAPYVPLLQTIFWIILLVLIFFLFRGQISFLAQTINERIKSGSPVKAGPFELGASLRQPETVAALDGIETFMDVLPDSEVLVPVTLATSRYASLPRPDSVPSRFSPE